MNVARIGARIAWFEHALAHAQENQEAEHMLFVQLTNFEVFQIQFGLWWLAKLYGAGAVSELIEKLHELIQAQEFCTCERCTREREEENGDS